MTGDRQGGVYAAYKSTGVAAELNDVISFVDPRTQLDQINA